MDKTPILISTQRLIEALNERNLSDLPQLFAPETVGELMRLYEKLAKETSHKNLLNLIGVSYLKIFQKFNSDKGKKVEDHKENLDDLNHILRSLLDSLTCSPNRHPMFNQLTDLVDSCAGNVLDRAGMQKDLVLT